MLFEIHAVALTVSDRAARGEREDVSGATLVELLKGIGALIVATEIVADERALIAEKLRVYAERGDVNFIVTTGGTGFAPRDVTPEATRDVIEREAPGLAEAMRFKTAQKTPTAILSRAVCGIRNQTLIINLPGSPTGVRECFDAVRDVLPHAIKILAGKDHEEK